VMDKKDETRRSLISDSALFPKCADIIGWVKKSHMSHKRTYAAHPKVFFCDGASRRTKGNQRGTAHLDNGR